MGIARALALNPEFIVCDEAISALDVSIQAQVVNMLMKFQRELGLTYLFIAHDLSMVRHIADETAVMYLGTMVEYGPTEEVYGHPAHPYTQGLLSAVPVADPDYEKTHHRIPMEGEVPSPIDPKPGCRFCGRCPWLPSSAARRRPRPGPERRTFLPLVIIWIRRNTTNEYNRNGSNCPGSGPTAGTASGFLRLGSRGEYHPRAGGH